MNRAFSHLLMGFFFAFVLASCGSGNPLPATPRADSAANSLPVAPNRVSPVSLPEVCNCVLRFDHISIEQGLSQNSVRVIFQDSTGFLWFGTEDGLNRYDGYAFKTFKPDPDTLNSLSDRWITAIVEDKDGYLWIGTRQGGLNRYDPRTEQFTLFRNDTENPSSISDDHINVLYLDNNGNLWIGTEQGLDLYDHKNGAFTRYSYNPFEPDSLTGKSVTAILQDNRGRLWIGTSSGGLNQFDPQSKTFTPYQNNPEDVNSISNDHITAILDAGDSTLWVGTWLGLDRFDPDTGQFKRYTHSDNDPQSIAGNRVNALQIDSTGNLWVGTNNGLDRLSEAGGRFIHYVNDPSYEKSLSNNFILAIYEDRGGVLWFGTYGDGVNKYDRLRDNFAYYRHNPENSNSLSGNFVFPIHVDSEGYAWIGTFGTGLNRLTWSTGQVIRYQHDEKKPNSIASNILYSIYEDRNGILWIGTANGLDRFDRRTFNFVHYQRDPDNPASLSANTVFEVFVDSSNSVWVGTVAGLDLLDRETGTFKHYTPQVGDPNSLSSSTVDVIYEDQDGNLWVGTSENGLNKFDRETEKFTQFHFNPNDKKSLSNDSILSIHQDVKGRLWIGTGGGGLNLYNPQTGTFSYFLEKEGLPNGVVYGILEDGLGYLWLSTNFGISRFDPETKAFRNFDANDGLQSNEFNLGASAKGRDGEFYFGGINGLTIFHPLSIFENSYLPQVTLTALTQDGQPIAIDSSIETTKQVVLEWPQNSLEFEFAALSYNQPDKNQYAYFLEGFDPDWQYIGTKRDGRYTNLPGGDYTLLLKAANSNGVWNEMPVRIEIKVVPPFWQTTWFRIILVFALAGVVAAGIRLRMKAIQDRNRQLERLVRERTSALEKRSQEIQALYQADERILRNVSLHQVFQTLVDVAVDTLNADRSVVFTWDEKHTKVIPRVSRGFLPETLKLLEFTKGEGVVGRALETGQPVIVRQIELNDFHLDIREALIAEGIRSFIHIPITVDNKIVGVFNISFTKPNLIGDDITRLFSALTHRASISIANMELFEQTKDLAVMEERNRLARDLHDSAKQKAFAALAQLGTARGILNGNSNSATLHLNEAENLVSDVIQELTFLVQEIYPIALQEKGLPAVLREYAFEWENRNDIKINLTLHKERRLPLGIEQAIYRVTQESLANVARHSHANHVDISLMYNGGTLQLSVADDGRGFDVGLKGHGLGLRSIRERVGSIHGTVQIQSAPGQGTRIIVQVPTKD
ncbi:MAG TPA: two-component regulator propeller domain-containing protein [Anaerolineales bacterium]|nr:two-component regulator propeller domain-containing protein [Anaerolineales bacterium]